MKKTVVISTFLFSVILFTACNKDKDADLQTNLEFEQKIPSGAATSRSDSVWIAPSNQQLNVVWNDMMSNLEYVDALNFIYLNGVFNWNEARLVKELDESNYLISVPSIMEDKIASVLFASVIDDSVTYFHVHLSFIQQSTEDIINTVGIEKTMLAITTFAAHEQHFGDYTSASLIEHLNSDLIRDAMFSVSPRGWCLIEVILYNHHIINESQTTGWHTANGTYYGPTEGSVIHGQTTEGFYEVYHFWAWCPDENDQDGWTANWSDNDDPSGGGSNPNSENLPDWTYHGYDLFEGGYEDCMFLYGGMAAAQFNAFRQQLLNASCGDAAAYAIQSTVINTIHGLCDDVDGVFPPPVINIEETINEISSILENNVFFAAGQLICRICDGNQNCIDEFSSCGAEDYIDCFISKIEDTPEILTLVDVGGFLASRSCKSSFAFNQVGTAYTCQVNTVKHAYKPSEGPLITYHIPELCIQVHGSDANNQPLDEIKAAELAAYAMDEARLRVLDLIEEGTINSNIQAKNDFKLVYKEKLLELTGGNITSSISYGACAGNVNISTYSVSIGGIALCIALW